MVVVLCIAFVRISCGAEAWHLENRLHGMFVGLPSFVDGVPGHVRYC